MEELELLSHMNEQFDINSYFLDPFSSLVVSILKNEVFNASNNDDRSYSHLNGSYLSDYTTTIQDQINLGRRCSLYGGNDGNPVDTLYNIAASLTHQLRSSTTSANITGTVMYPILYIEDYGHPFRFAVARIEPELPMRTSFDKPRPTSFRDRVPSLGSISFEPHIVNQMKLNFPKESYDEMVRRISGIQLPEKAYNPKYKSKARASGSGLYRDNDSKHSLDDTLAADTKLFEFGDAANDDSQAEDDQDSDDEDIVEVADDEE